jgi:hypothetical protein
MGFFSKVRKRIKKLIPKEVRPFVPYAAAMLPGIGGLAGAYGKFANAALARAATDDEADLKDIARTGIFAAAPTALGDYAKTGNSAALSFGDKGFLSQQAKLGAAKAAGYAEQNPFKTAAAMGSTDAAIKQVELNEDALDKYNRELAAQGINDKAGRRAAIRSIYANTGTWDMDEVDGMLDTYGYRTGGRVGLKKGDRVLMNKMTKNDAYHIEDEDEDEDEGMSKKDYEEYENSLKYAKEGYDMLYPEIKNQPIRALRLAEGGSVDALMERIKELQDEGLDFASAMAQAQKEMKAQSKYAGGIMDVNENINIETPRGDVDMDVNSMESIKGQTAGPDWYMDRLQHLEFLGYNYETAGEIAYDTDRYMNVIEMDIAPGPGEGDDDYARGGRVGRAEGGIMQVADSTLMDQYKIYKFDMMEQGLEPMSLQEFIDQTMAEGKMAMTGDREWIIDSSRDNFANDMFGKDYDDLSPDEVEEIDIIIEMELGKNQAAPERTMAAGGGLMNLGGREMDLRGGGFVPMGKAERADDVPARLSKNEFVMTADAVRAAGGGSIKKGADLMHDQMKQLEAQA